MAIDLKVTSNYAGKSVSTTVSDISPAATNAQLVQLGRKLIDFSDGTYEKGSRVETINVDTTPGGGVKPEPTLTLDKTTVAASEISRPGEGIVPVIITTNSDGQLYFRPATLQDNVTKLVYCGFLTLEGATKLAIGKWGNDLVAQTVYVGVTETDNYAGKEVAFTITE